MSSSKGHWPRRVFLQRAAVAPGLRLLAAAAAPAQTGVLPVSEKFTPLDLSKLFNASPADAGARAPVWMRNRIIVMPAGHREFRGIPFYLGPEGERKKSWIALSSQPSQWSAAEIEIPIHAKARYLCVAQFCDWDQNVIQPKSVDDIEKVGEVLAEAAIVYEDGTENVAPIRRRFEVDAPSVTWGQHAFLALPHPQFRPVRLDEPLDAGTSWGKTQTTVTSEQPPVWLWIWPMPNPRPDATVSRLRLRAKSAEFLAVCGVTLFHGSENPLNYGRLRLYRITLPDPQAEDRERWNVSVDLGVVARTHVLPEFHAESWLNSPQPGIGEKANTSSGIPCMYAEVSAAHDTTLNLHDNKTGRDYKFSLAEAAGGTDVPANSGPARIQVLEREKTWLHCRVTDSGTKRQAPVRIAFRSKTGRYIPPYGHRTEINSAWFQDYGADLKQLDSSFAYVDGAFQVELPVGEVYVEMMKGFEYEPVRKRLDIRPNQKELTLDINRFVDLRSKGWVTADTHVHFLSPSSAVLEAQAEGLNLINLPAAQWGDLYTNFGDLAHGGLTSKDGENMVWLGTENRSHLLGHIGLLGNNGDPVLPLSGSFPNGNDEAYFGDPLWSSMAEWSDACHSRDGLAVAVHFPFPLAEIVADILLGKIDAVELMPRPTFDNLSYFEYYRYLNCGYRLPAVSGTDKMSAGTAAGQCRTYAQLGGEPFTFANWTKAVKSGDTFVTAGPLLFLSVDGHPPGAEISLRPGGGTVEVEARAMGPLPIKSIEIVLNGREVSSRRDGSGPRELLLRDKVRLDGPGWIAARCESEPGAGWFERRPAHTSPVYLKMPGQDLFSAPAASYFLNVIAGTRAWATTMATRPDATRLARVLKVLDDARDLLHRRLHAHHA